MQGVEHADVELRSRGTRDPTETALQGTAVQLLRVLEGGGTPYQPSRDALRRAGEHGASGWGAFRKTRHLVAGNDVAVFGIVRMACKISGMAAYIV